MGNLLVDYGFESEAWSLTNAPLWAKYVTTPVYAGSKALYLQILPGTASGAAESPAFAIAHPGVEMEISVWTQSSAGDIDIYLLVQHYASGTGGGRSEVGVIESTYCVGAWKESTFTITPNGADDAVYIRATSRNPAAFPAVWFYIDNVVYARDALAVKLAERAVDAIETCLQTNLGTELTAIDTDRADGITMADPPAAQYYKRPKAEIAGFTGAAHIEIFEGSFDFDSGEEGGASHPYSDADAQRATYDIPVTVRVTWFGRDGTDTRDTMVIRGRRYSAGVFNVFNKYPTLGGGDDAIQGAHIQAVTPAWEELGEEEPGRFKGRITMTGEVRCEEVQT